MSGKNLSLRIAAILLPTLAASSAQAAVTFNTLAISASTTATAKRAATTVTNSDTKSVSLATLPTVPNVATSATTAAVKVSGISNIQSNAASTAVAYFQDASTGTFDVTSINSIVQAAASTTSVPISGSAKSGAYDFAYAFKNSGTALFSLDYDLASPFAGAALPVLAELTGPGGFSSSLGHISSGTITAVLGSGSYILHFHSGFEDLISRSGAGIGSTVGGSLDHFSFSVAALPEASTWMMMILGFGAVGTALRRSPRRVHFA